MEPVPTPFNLAAYCLAPAPHRDPGAVALTVVHDVGDVAGAQRLTFGELDGLVCRVAAGMLDSGIAPGDRIVLRLGNSVDMPLVWFAALAVGILPVPTSDQLTAEEVAHIVRDCGAVEVVTPAEVAAWRETGRRTAYRDSDGDEPAYLVYTSGTSGVPKGVLHAHRAGWGRRPMYAGWHDLRRGDVLLHAGALNWTYTLGVGLVDPWAVGASAVVYDGPRSPEVWPRLIDAVGASVFAAVPGVYRQMLARGRLESASLASLRHGLTAGEALAPSLWSAWTDSTGVPLYESLGMSEISTFVSSSPIVPTRPGSPGRPQAGRWVAVLPSGGGAEPLPEGEVGLLAVHRSDPGLMLGYWQRPEEDAAVWRGEWFVSGDLVHLDADGYVVHHGRDDDVMTSMGYRISPLEVEHVLEAHPSVGECAVTEVEVADGVRVVTAFVVPAPGAAVGEETLLEHARAHLAAYKCPRRVIVMHSLPRTANGKIQRRVLAEGARTS